MTSSKAPFFSLASGPPALNTPLCICYCWRNPWSDCDVTQTPKCNEPAKIGHAVNCGLTIYSCLDVELIGRVFFLLWQLSSRQRRSQGGCWRCSSTPLSDQDIDVYFLSFSPTLYCKSRSGASQNVLWQSHRRSNTFLIKPSVYEFSRFEKYSSFLHSCVFCSTIHNKSWALSCSASVETSMTFELPTVSIDV